MNFEQIKIEPCGDHWRAVYLADNGGGPPGAVEGDLRRARVDDLAAHGQRVCGSQPPVELDRLNDEGENMSEVQQQVQQKQPTSQSKPPRKVRPAKPEPDPLRDLVGTVAELASAVSSLCDATREYAVAEQAFEVRRASIALSRAVDNLELARLLLLKRKG